MKYQVKLKISIICIGLVVSSFSVLDAQANVRCYWGSQGYPIGFILPDNGKIWQCQGNGNWIQIG